MKDAIGNNYIADMQEIKAYLERITTSIHNILAEYEGAEHAYKAGAYEASLEGTCTNLVLIMKIIDNKSELYEKLIQLHEQF